MGKKIIYDHDARNCLESGISILAKAVGVTLGPKGKNVILERKSGTPQIVNDGVTIAKEIELKHPLENMGVSLVRQAALKTNDVVGDGTTTATILAHAIVKEGIKNITSGSNPILIKRGIEKAVKFVVDKISEYARPVLNIKDIVKVASISAGNNILVGNTIAAALKQVGQEGIISLEEGNSTTTSVHVTSGMSFSAGYISHYFLSNSMDAEISQDNPWVLLTDMKITNIQDELISTLEQVALTGRPLLIIAEEIEQEVLSTLILNKIKGTIDVVAVRIPGFGDRKQAFLDDISILTNSTIISDKLGFSLSNMSLDLMGSAKRITISKDTTTIISNVNRQIISLHYSSLRKRMEFSIDHYERQTLQDRLSKLGGGVAIIKVGSTTSTEMTDNKLRFEDAINATRAAIEEGILPGGGSAFLHLSEDLYAWSGRYLTSDELLGAQIVARALQVPLCKIVENTGVDGFTIAERLKNTDFSLGYDANSYKITDLYDIGIIDPAKVTRLALQNASSIASIILTTECIISDNLIEVKA